MMKKNIKGLALFPVVTAIVCVAVGVVIGGTAMYLYGRMHSGGLGDGTDIAIQANENIPLEEIPELSETIAVIETTETETETEPPTEPVTERGGYVVISVVGNDYLYGNQIYDLDAMLAVLHNSKELPSVKIVNEKASRKAYQELYSALQNDNISIIRTDETE